MLMNIPAKSSFKNHTQKGSALVLALISVITLGTLSAVSAGLILNENVNSERSNNMVMAMNVAEAGMDYALWEILHGGNDFSGWTDSGSDKVLTATLQTNGGINVGEYTITLDPTVVPVVVQCTGYYPNSASPIAQRTVQVKFAERNLFTKALYGLQEVDFSANSLVDSYDHTIAPYDPLAPGSEGHIGCNSITAGAIDTDADGIQINGNVTVGVGGTSDVVSDTSKVTGTITAATSPAYAPSVAIPTPDSDYGGSLTIPVGTTANISDYSLTPGEIFKVDKLTLNNSAQLVFDQDVTLYVDGQVSMKNNSKMIIQNGVKVEIISADTYSCNATASIDTESGDPIDFTIYLLDTADRVSFVGDITLIGTIYAPNSECKFQGATEIFGGVTANYIRLQSGHTGQFHYDVSLATRDGAPSAGMGIRNWQTK